MTISITSPTSTTSKIQQNGNDVLTVDSSNNVTVINNLSVSGTVSSTGAITFNGGVSGNVNFDSGTLYVDATNNRVGIGTSSPNYPLHVVSDSVPAALIECTGSGPNAGLGIVKQQGSGDLGNWNAISINGNDNVSYESRIQWIFDSIADGPVIGGKRTGSGETQLAFHTNSGETLYERMRIDSSGNVLINTTNVNPTTNNVVGTAVRTSGSLITNADGAQAISAGRAQDGVIVYFYSAGTIEGNISVSGTTVSYNGGHLARFAQLPNSTKDETILKGTVLSNLDDMCVYVNKETGETVDNEQLNKVKVSDVEGDQNVAGVHVAWIYDEQHDVEEINMAMTGDMIIRIAQGVTVNRGDLLMSAGDGTAKPQGDDIVRSKTIAKVTSTNVTCTYDDGSYCVPCVLMAC